MIRSRVAWAAAAALLAGCGGPTTGGAIGVSQIEPAEDAGTIAPPTEGGLVRLDRDGQVIAGAAVRWAILDNGLDYIFRIDDAAGMPAAAVARRLRATFRDRSNPHIRALGGAIESITAVTPTVVELRLTAPQPDLLPLLARAEFAVGAPGPLRRSNGLLVGISAAEPRPAPVELRRERVGRAVARFRAEQSEAVLGGTFANLAVARAADLPRRLIRFDPATGLFGFVVRDVESAYADAGLRQALSLAIDRDRIVALIGSPGLAKATTLAGSTLEPSLAERRATAASLVAGRDLPALRVAMPEGPGARLLFALVAQDWARIGIAARAVKAEAPADLALVDLVTSPSNRAALACAVSDGCDPRDPLALLAPPYIPIAAPVRWSLVARRLERFQENGLAAHPLDQLR